MRSARNSDAAGAEAPREGATGVSTREPSERADGSSALAAFEPADADEGRTGATDAGGGEDTGEHCEVAEMAGKDVTEGGEHCEVAGKDEAEEGVEKRSAAEGCGGGREGTIGEVSDAAELSGARGRAMADGTAAAGKEVVRGKMVRAVAGEELEDAEEEAADETEYCALGTAGVMEDVVAAVMSNGLGDEVEAMNRSVLPRSRGRKRELEEEGSCAAESPTLVPVPTVPAIPEAKEAQLDSQSRPAATATFITLDRLALVLTLSEMVRLLFGPRERCPWGLEVSTSTGQRRDRKRERDRERE